jgi:hypothetical protein
MMLVNRRAAIFKVRPTLSGATMLDKSLLPSSKAVSSNVYTSPEMLKLPSVSTNS